ncbi:MAG: hypothetical protein II748_06970 [Clostridia bacterium]|jgi:Flp pilus assembly pilin Flp|nr:hypothetical protein [Clostridia bacterium]
MIGREIKRLVKEEDGINTVEVVIILAVLVTLAFVFKDFIMDLAGSIFGKITAKTEKNIDDLARFFIAR